IFITLKQMKVKDLAAALVSHYEGNGDLELIRVAPLDEAGPADLSFAQGRALKQALDSKAGCLIVPEKVDFSRTIIRAADPLGAPARAITILHPRPAPPPVIHPTAVVDPSTVIAPTASIGPHVAIGANVTIGERCTIHSNVSIYRDVSIGDDVVIHSGCV